MVQPPWQDALNPQLTQRLLRPLICPGVIPDTLAMAIFERSRRFKQRLSLLQQFQQRWGKQSTLQVPDVPIVYAHWIAPETQSVIFENPTDRNREGSSELNPNREGSSEWMRIKRERTTSSQIVTQQTANGSTVSTFSLPLVIQAKFVDPVTSPLPPMPSDSMPLQSLSTGGRESALPSISAVAPPQRPQLPIVTSSPRSPFIESELNRGISSLAEEKALVVKAKNQPVLPILPQLPQQTPQLRLSAIGQPQLPIGMPPAMVSGLNAAIAAPKLSSSRLLEELPLLKVEKTAALPSSQVLRQPTQPLVFARSAPTQVPSSNQELPMTTTSNHQPTERSPIVNAQPADQRLSTSTVSPTQPPAVDVSYLTQQVERKLMRKLTVERERRGQRTWH